jgi:hypothetical protein
MEIGSVEAWACAASCARFFRLMGRRWISGWYQERLEQSGQDFSESDRQRTVISILIIRLEMDQDCY